MLQRVERCGHGRRGGYRYRQFGARVVSRGMAGDTNRRAVLLDGDLSKAGLIKQLRQRADRVMIDGWALRWTFWTFGHRRAFRLARHEPALAPIRAARPVMASA